MSGIVFICLSVMREEEPQWQTGCTPPEPLGGVVALLVMEGSLSRGDLTCQSHNVSGQWLNLKLYPPSLFLQLPYRVMDRINLRSSLTNVE